MELITTHIGADFEPSPYIKSISKKMRQGLSGHILQILKAAGEIADKRRYRVFAVGGFVRDMFLGIKNLDVDIAVEGDGIAFAKELVGDLGGSLVIYKRFGTASVITDATHKVKDNHQKIDRERFKIDIATARTETYEYPAALPKVKFSSIKQDLYRRDFTINAMAVSLNSDTFGQVADFFNGQHDLGNKKVRVLHNLSFVEDPTRIFRAVRFEQRYNFSIDTHTEYLIKTAVSLDMFGRTQKQRLRDEIILILSEPRPKNALMRMYQLHELRFIHDKIRFSKNMLKLFDSLDETIGWYRSSFSRRGRVLNIWIIYFFAILDNISLPEVKHLCGKFVFTKTDRQQLISCKKNAKSLTAIFKSQKKLLPSEIYKHLEPLSHEVIVFIMARAGLQIARERISLFLRKYNGLKLSIGGEDLKDLGVAPGPRYKKILKRVLYAKLDGKLVGKRGELALAERFSKA